MPRIFPLLNSNLFAFGILKIFSSKFPSVLQVLQAVFQVIQAILKYCADFASSLFSHHYEPLSKKVPFLSITASGPGKAHSSTFVFCFLVACSGDKQRGNYTTTGITRGKNVKRMKGKHEELPPNDEKNVTKFTDVVSTRHAKPRRLFSCKKCTYKNS